MSRESKERFDRIHRHYDFFNHLFSLGVDIGWRKEAANESMIGKKSYDILDVATGTGDLAMAISRAAKENGKSVKIIGIDFNQHMLDHAKEKVERMGIGNIRIERGDALEIRFGDSTFDVVTSGFALRNFDDLNRFAREAYRVMKKGGKLVMLDMSRPDNNLWFMKSYFKLMEAIGSLAGKDAYKWLTQSILNFDKHKVAGIFRKQGFSNVKVKELRTGVAFIITGRK